MLGCLRVNTGDNMSDHPIQDLTIKVKDGRVSQFEFNGQSLMHCNDFSIESGLDGNVSLNVRFGAIRQEVTHLRPVTGTLYSTDGQPVLEIKHWDAMKRTVNLNITDAMVTEEDDQTVLTAKATLYRDDGKVIESLKDLES